MAFATYSATRGTLPYHVAAATYGISFATQPGSRPSPKSLRSVQTSLSGVQETQFYGEQRVWTITSAPVQVGSSIEELLVEFLSSTADGQSFSFDPYSDDGSTQLLTVQRYDDGYNEETFQEVNGVTDLVTFRFQLLEA